MNNPMPERAVKDAGALPADNTPWYRQFWPWFLIALPATVVVAGLSTVWIATQNQSSLVVDDYYKQGLGINQTLQEDAVAKQLQLGAELSADLTTGEILLSLKGDTSAQTETLILEWIHPTNGQRDQSLSLRRGTDGRYRSQLIEPLVGRWYIQLQGEQPQPWRLRAEMSVQSGEWVQLQFGQR